jgi:hypothetical protein
VSVFSFSSQRRNGSLNGPKKLLSN